MYADKSAMMVQRYVGLLRSGGVGKELLGEGKLNWASCICMSKVDEVEEKPGFTSGKQHEHKEKGEVF